MKNMLQKFLSKQRALQSILGLFFGFIIIFIVGLFIFNIYLGSIYYHGNRERSIRDISRIIAFAQILPPEQLQKNLQLLTTEHIRVRVTDVAPDNAQLLINTNRAAISELTKHSNHLRLSVKLPDGRWLLITERLEQHPWLLIGILASTLLLLLALLFLSIWAVKRAIVPLEQFAQAAKRFGVDMQSPPLAEQGPPEMREAIHAFNEMQNRVRRLLHDRTQMLAAISHDLRTPITRLQLRLEYLENPEQHQKAVSDLEEMEQMISSILFFARESLRTEEIQRFDLNALLSSICDELIDMGKSVIYHSQNKLPFVGRMIALKRALTNLIENAVKYGNNADVQLESKDKHIQIKISDQGPGIPEAQLEKVFEPFYRIDSARTPQIAGTGLGLTVARDIIRAHGGDIRLFNRKPHGLTAVISLSR